MGCMDWYRHHSTFVGYELIYFYKYKIDATSLVLPISPS